MVKIDIPKISKFIRDKIFVPKTDLINFIMDNYKCSKPTAVRHIQHFIDSKELIKITKDEYSVYDIIEKDNRIVYIGLKQNKEIIQYINNRLEELSKEKSEKNKMLILRDISLYRDDLIYAKNVDDLINILKLNINDKELINSVGYTLVQLILENNIEVINQTEFRTILKKLLEKYNKYDSEFSNLKRWILYLLAHYDDKQVLIQLEDDLINENEDYVKHTYSVKYITNYIHNHREDLYKLQQKFNFNGLTRQTDLILQIRYNVNKLLNIKKSESEIL
ncbi:hypothetical protein GW835_01050 [archaeon]|nr:hypothetical protein [archaeon]NCP79141.1 hypothetical protein [archaeon]NCP97913.1 hypothetical protein [archaeon]NCQ06908.1 hypothetical protein [archaeon]NCQ50704.1 hypothetical protein [archaeon]